MLKKEDLKHLCDLARIEVPAAEEEKLLKDLGEILDHFEELKEIDTDQVAPMTGGTALKNVVREDEAAEQDIDSWRSVGQFPDKEGDFLKIPPVFE
jgi:aspartyl-tRNA(Asn)/glutamyl-tRNA(Gln) amidotransferase subunit C